MRIRRSARFWCILFLSLYAGLLAARLSRLSLSLDEVLDLLQSRGPRLETVLAYVPANAGGVPLGYLARFAAIRWLGVTPFAGRLPSAIFSVAACWGIFVLARRMRLRWPLVAVVLFAACPLQFRYALEGRSYAQGLCLTIYITIVFLQLVERPESKMRACLYAVLIALGLYTQPFTLFVPLAHLAWLMLPPRRARLIAATALAILSAGLAFAPWYWHSAAIWSGVIAEGKLAGNITWHIIPMILHELTGTGYLGTALALVGVCVALWVGLAERRDAWFWLLYLAVPLMLAPAADAAFGYFFAIRQTIFVIAPLSLLLALAAHRPKVGFALAAAFWFASVYQDAAFCRRPREDWRTATGTAQGVCVVLARLPVPCTSESFSGASGVAFAIDPDRNAAPPGGHEARLLHLGFTRQKDFSHVGPRIELYRRP